MNKKIRLLLLILPLFYFNSVSATIISLSPSNTFATNGDLVTLDLTISGLNNGGADSLGDFDLDIFYDSTVLSVNSFSLSSWLGDPLDALDLSLGDDGFGTLSLSQISLLSVIELDALQPDSFSLAELTFSVDNLPLNTQTTVEVGTIYALGDAFGNSLAVDEVNDAIIQNQEQTIVVTEPPILWLLIPSFLILVRRFF